MVFKYPDAINITRKIVEKYNGRVTIGTLSKLVMIKTGTMMPYWVERYIKSMVSAKLIQETEEGFIVMPSIRDAILRKDREDGIQTKAV